MSKFLLNLYLCVGLLKKKTYILLMYVIHNINILLWYDDTVNSPPLPYAAYSPPYPMQHWGSEFSASQKINSIYLHLKLQLNTLYNRKQVYYIITYRHIISYYFIISPYRITSYHIASSYYISYYHIISHHIILLYYHITISYHIMT